MVRPVAVITGGSSGIGLAAVKLFCQSGYQVYTCARREFDFAKHVPSDQLCNIGYQMIDVQDTRRLADWIHSIGSQSPLDVLINNAAIVHKKPLTEFTSHEFEQSLSGNLLAALESVKAAIGYFNSQQGGTLINVSSMAAVDPFPGFSVYGSCKAFLELFTQAMAGELADARVKSYAIRAGTVETPLLRRVLPDFPSSETLAPFHVAELMLALAQGDMPFPNGSAIEITHDNFDSILSGGE